MVGLQAGSRQRAFAPEERCEGEMRDSGSRKNQRLLFTYLDYTRGYGVLFFFFFFVFFFVVVVCGEWSKASGREALINLLRRTALAATRFWQQ